jgi:uncharacterized protein YqkB
MKTKERWPMEITVTASAQSEIETRLTKNKMGAIKLVYDNEDCGCAVNGVAQLWMVPKTNANDEWQEAAGSSLQILYAEKDAIYFEDRLMIDYRASGRAFVLKSNNQIYNHHLDLLEKGE